LISKNIKTHKQRKNFVRRVLQVICHFVSNGLIKNAFFPGIKDFPTLVFFLQGLGSPGGEQISFIKRKLGYLLVKLYPYLKNASADARKDIWQTMVKPLFNAALLMFNFEPSETQKENLERTWIGTFKQFMMINKAAPTELINKMINCDLRQLASNLVEECKNTMGR